MRWCLPTPPPRAVRSRRPRPFPLRPRSFACWYSRVRDRDHAVQRATIPGDPNVSMGNGDGSRSEPDRSNRMTPGRRFLARHACGRRKTLCCLPAPRDKLRHFLTAFLPDLLEVLVSVFFGDRVAADLADAAVEPRPVQLFHFPSALLADLLVEVRAVPLCRSRAPASARLRDGHRAFVPRHLGHPFSPIQVG